MGAFQSKIDPKSIDLLGYKSQYTELNPKSLEKVKQLLHALFGEYEFNSCPSILVSLFYLGVSPAQLTHIFDKLSQNFVEFPDEDPIADSIGEETMDEFYGKQEYEKRYYEFFRDQLTEFPDWPEVVARYVPILGTRLFGDHFSPLIQLGAACEINDPVLAMQALAMACTANVQLPKYESDEDRNVDDLLAAAVQTKDPSLAVACQAFIELSECKLSFSSEVSSLLFKFSAYFPPSSSWSTTQIDWPEEIQRVESKDFGQAPYLRSLLFAHARLKVDTSAYL